MATAPYQLWIDLPQLTTASRTSSTVTITTNAAHGLVVGSYVQIEGLTGTAGSTMNGVFEVLTVPTTTTFTYTAAGTAGSGTTTDSKGNYIGVASIDLLRPLIDLTSANRRLVPYVELDGLTLSASGDGQGSSFGFSVRQDLVPAAGPFMRLIPDDARVRFVKKNTGQTPASDASDVLFIGVISTISLSLNDAGVGCRASITCADLSSLLERVIVTGQSKQVATRIESIARAANVVTVETNKPHGLGIGDAFYVRNVIGGGPAGVGTAAKNGTSFNTTGTSTYTVATQPTTTSFTFSQSGTASTGDTWKPIGSVLRRGSTLNEVNILLSGTAFIGLQAGSPLTIKGFTQTLGTNLSELLNRTHDGANVLAVSGGTQVRLKLPKDSVTEWNRVANLVYTNAQMRGGDGEGGNIIPSKDNTPTLSKINIAGNVSEDSAVAKVLENVDGAKSSDYAFQRLFKTSTSSKIIGGSQNNATGFTLPAGTLRSVLDGIMEAMSGQDSKERRYFIDPQGRLNYVLANTSSLGSAGYATAPYAIITSGGGSPNAVNALSTIAATELTIDLDHSTTKRALVTVSSDTGATSKDLLYTESGYPKRLGSPNLDGVIESPTKTSSTDTEVPRIAKSFFLERRAPLIVGKFRLTGAGTQSFNQYGFISGYRQTGASTFALVSTWAPGQAVSVTAPELGLSGLFSVEEVAISFEPGSYIATVDVTFNRRATNTLTAALRAGG